MPSTYSPNLQIQLIATGDQAGTWGSTTNTNLGTLIEQAISGYTQYALSAGTNTLSMSPGTSATARNMYLELTGVGGSTLVVPAGAAYGTGSKLYFIYNNTSLPASAVTVKTAAGTGVSVTAGQRVCLICDGVNVVNALNYIPLTTFSASISTTGIVNTGTITSTGDVSGSSLTATGNVVPANGVYLPSSNTLGFASNTLARGSISTNGVWTINAPSAGNHTVNLLAGSNGIAFTAGAHTVNLYSDGSTQYIFGTTTTIPFKFLCNNVVVGTIATTGGWSISVPTSGVALTVNGVAGTHSTQIADNNNSKFDAGYLGIPQNAQTSAYVLTHQDRGKHISITTGGVTINAAPYLVGTSGSTANWSAGDSFVIFNNSGSSQNITAGASVTLRLAGTATSGTPRALAQYGVATCLCVVGGATPTFVISGAGVT